MEQFLRRRNSETSIEEEDEQDEGSQQQSETRISKRNSLSSRPGGRIKKQKTQSGTVLHLPRMPVRWLSCREMQRESVPS
jgi:hypothetical protein